MKPAKLQQGSSTVLVWLGAAFGDRMKIAVHGCAGFFLSAIAGYVIGVGLGFLWTTMFHTTSFEGYSGMLVFFAFIPICIIVGAVAGAVGLGLLVSRDDAATRSGSAP
jgi:hypothetical protein